MSDNHALPAGSTVPVRHASGPGLKTNHLSFIDVVSQSIGVIAPSGTPGLVIPVVFATAGNGTWLAYAFATVALLIVSLQINVFSSRIASPGSLYVYAGHGLGRFAGVISGWALLIGYVFTAAAVINGTVSTTLAVLQTIGFTGTTVPILLTFSVLAAAIAFAFGWRDIRLSTRTTLIFEFTTLGLILLTLVLWFIHHGSVTDTAQTGLQGVNPTTLRLGLVLAFFSFVGFESATVLGVESQQPRRFIPRAVLASVAGVGIAFVFAAYGLTAAFHGLTPTLDQSNAPLTTVTKAFGFGPVGIVISVGVALSFFTCILASINAAARVLYTLAHHGLFHSSARATHDTHASPHIALTVVTVVAIGLSAALTLDHWALLDAYGILGSLATYGFLVAYGLVTIAAPVYLLRRHELKPLHVLTALSAFALLLVALAGTVYPVPAWPYNILPYIFLGLLLIGVLYFLALRAIAPTRLAQVESEILGKS
jgi:amino acid transporter